MNVLTYKGYSAAVVFDGEDMILTGRIAGINDVVGFHADDADGIKAAFEEAVEDYLATCEKVGKTPDKTYSGKVMFRLTPELHAQIAKAAELSDMSINQWGECMLSKMLLGEDSGCTVLRSQRENA